MPRGTLKVIEFDPRRGKPATPQCSPDHEESQAPLDLLSHIRLRYRSVTNTTVAIAVVALHALALTPLLVGGSSTISDPLYGTPTIIQATLIDDQSASTITPPSLSRPHMRPMHTDLPDIPNRTKSQNPALAALYGRYLGQIHARIDRAWLRPRTAIGADIFRCQVEIRQRHDGTVKTVTLQRCNGTPTWQQSLAQGISAASPLPAPPDPRVFAHRVVLHFEAVAYRLGQPADEYEPEPPAAPGVDADSSGVLGQIHSFGQAAKRPHGPSVIELRIDGSRIEVEPQR